MRVASEGIATEGRARQLEITVAEGALSQEWGSSDSDGELIMTHAPLSYRRHRFPAEIIQHAIWLYLRFTLSYRDVEELLAGRGLDVSYETVRR
jgi:hypothetical protein